MKIKKAKQGDQEGRRKKGIQGGLYDVVTDEQRPE